MDITKLQFILFCLWVFALGHAQEQVTIIDKDMIEDINISSIAEISKYIILLVGLSFSSKYSWGC